MVCPLGTVLNWKTEYEKWLPEDNDIELFELVSVKKNFERLYQVKEWVRCGGVLIIGYDMFRLLSNVNNKRMNKRMRETFYSALVDPGK